MIDLRSDTVTRPTPPMREAMARAEVGDDVFGEDPTVNSLEEHVAKLLGKEAAVFVPSGTMANQVALKTHTQPGDDVLVGEGAHNWLYESGAGAVISGVQFTICGRGGLFDVAELEPAFKPEGSAFGPVAPTRLVCVENTHNRAGGRVWPETQTSRVTAWAKDRGLATHLDGARLWNAAIALGRPPAALADPFDSVSVCLSKGLGAPVGSLVVGRSDFVRRSRRWRKMLGGGMRQAGILAAAGRYALDHHFERLAEDHRHARRLGEALASMKGVTLHEPVETNIVLINLADAITGAQELCARARAEGLLIHPFGPRQVRAALHLDVDSEAVERAIGILGRLLSS